MDRRGIVSIQDHYETLNEPSMRYYPVFAQFMDSLAGAIFLSQLVEWHDEHGEAFSIPDAEVCAHLGMSRKELKSAQHFLCATEILDIEHHGVPPTTAYRLSAITLVQAVSRMTVPEDVQDFQEPPVPAAISAIRKDVTKRYPRLFIRLGNAQGFQCQQCPAIADLQIDHKHPVAKGGSNDLNNLQLLCMTCNTRKGARLTKQDT